MPVAPSELSTTPAPADLAALENGDHLTAPEFLRRYEARPDVKKAELIEGIVYMGAPVRIRSHAAPDSLVSAWLVSYAAHTPGTLAAANGTVQLDLDNAPQPDSLLLILPECGGQARFDGSDYLIGAPELVVEVAASSRSIDTREKLTAYRRNGVREYLIWRTLDGQFDWFRLAEGE
jgi:Uma2 family endonuclease